jgi:hypothetical protein
MPTPDLKLPFLGGTATSAAAWPCRITAKVPIIPAVFRARAGPATASTTSAILPDPA